MDEGLVYLNRIGSDPEFSFVTHGGDQILSADVLVGADKEVRMKSFIGTDGHAATGELRPFPCHNVYWHLVKIADGLHAIRKALPFFSRKHGTDIQVMAQPSFNPHETMGGHIWISMWYKSKLAAEVIHGMGHIYYVSAGECITSRQQNNKLYAPVGPQRYQKYTDLAAVGEELSIDLAVGKLHYLLWPLEMMLFGNIRSDRTNQAVVKDPLFRFPDAPHPQADLAYHKPGYAYLRFEYRLPTTWLQHPTIAFVYLALAKLAILNWSILPGLASNSNGFPPYIDLTHKPGYFKHASEVESWRTTFNTRVNALFEHPKFKATKDLAGLRDAIREINKVSLRMPLLVNFDAWEQVRGN